MPERRFLDLSRSLAPDKFTAEVRSVPPLNSSSATASIAWGATPSGPFRTIWTYDPRLSWKDQVAIDRTLVWPEVDRNVAVSGAREIYVRYRFAGLALDDIRLSAESVPATGACPLQITHLWKEDGADRSATRQVPDRRLEWNYTIDTSSSAAISNEALVIECPAAHAVGQRR